MSISIRFSGAKDQDGDEEIFLLGSNTLWDAIVEWVKVEVPEPVCPLLHNLVEEGNVTNTFELDVELEVALDEYAPPSYIREALTLLMDDMGAGAEDETLTVVHE